VVVYRAHWRPQRWWQNLPSNKKEKASVIPLIGKKDPKDKIGAILVNGVTQCHHSIQCIRLPIHLLQKVCLVLLSRYSGLFVKSCRFFLSYVYFAPYFGMTPIEFHQGLWQQKTRIHKLSCIAVCMLISLAILIEQWIAKADRWTDRGYFSANK